MSNIKNEVEIVHNNPFQNCKFERQGQADILENVIKYTKDNVVINITAPWGYGKTTFLKMLKQQMTNKGLVCIYFSAWEYDYVDDPFSALIGHISKEFEAIEHINDKNKAKELFKVAMPIIGNIGLKILTANLLDSKSIEEIISSEDQTEISTNIGNYTEKILGQYMETSLVIEKFKNDLTEFAKLQKDSQVIIIVDELDRCRPNFSIEMLERIKHIMSVKGVKFILGTDKEQLAESIKVLYGNNFNSIKYLERFIDFEYKLDIPTHEQYINALIKEFNIYNLSNNSDNIVKDSFLVIAIYLCNLLQIDLRSLRQIFFRFQLMLISMKFETNKFIFPEYLFYRIAYEKKDIPLSRDEINKKIFKEIYNKISGFRLQATILYYGSYGFDIFPFSEDNNKSKVRNLFNALSDNFDGKYLSRESMEKLLKNQESFNIELSNITN